MELFYILKLELCVWTFLNMNWKNMICGMMNYRRRRKLISLHKNKNDVTVVSQWICVWMSSLKGENLVVFYYVSALCTVLITGVSFWWEGLIRMGTPVHLNYKNVSLGTGSVSQDWAYKPVLHVPRCRIRDALPIGIVRL